MKKVQAYAVVKTIGMDTILSSLSFRTYDKHLVNIIIPDDENNPRFKTMKSVIKYILNIAKMNNYSIPLLYYEFGSAWYDITFIDLAFPQPSRYGYYEEV